MPTSSQNFLQTTAWVLEPKTLEVVDAILSARLNGEKLDLEAIEAARGSELKNRDKNRPYDVVDGVAVIYMNGVMGKRMGMLDAMSGGVSTQRIQMQLEDALTDPAIDAVVLSIDSPGGTVDGTAELGDWMLANRGIKPVHAYADGTMASGGLWIGGCCDKITAFRTARVGSLSAVMCHYDRSEKDSKDGVKRTFITSGEYKRMGNDAEPLSKKGETYLQHSIDRYHAMFVEAYAEGRGMTPEEVQEKYGDGRMHIADEALQIGMVDALGTLTDTINAAREAATQEVRTMTKVELKEKFPEVHASLIAEGKAQAQTEFEDQVKVQGDQLVSDEQERMIGLYGSLHGEEAQAGFTKLAASGMDATQIEALEACGFSKAGAQDDTTDGGGEDTKKKILDNLEDDDTNLSTDTSGDDTVTFMGVVDAMVKEDGMTRINAMKKVAADSPDLHAAYLGQKKAA